MMLKQQVNYVYAHTQLYDTSYQVSKQPKISQHVIGMQLYVR